MQEKIIEGLRAWMKVSTWSTGHPLDQERFHLALKDVFDTCGLPISGDNFESAMRALAVELQYDYQLEYLDQKLGHYAQLAENIGSYLYDTRIR